MAPKCLCSAGKWFSGLFLEALQNIFVCDTFYVSWLSAKEVIGWMWIRLIKKSSEIYYWGPLFYIRVSRSMCSQALSQSCRWDHIISACTYPHLSLAYVSSYTSIIGTHVVLQIRIVMQYSWVLVTILDMMMMIWGNVLFHGTNLSFFFCLFFAGHNEGKAVFMGCFLPNSSIPAFSDR